MACYRRWASKSWDQQTREREEERATEKSKKNRPFEVIGCPRNAPADCLDRPCQIDPPIEPLASSPTLLHHLLAFLANPMPPRPSDVLRCCPPPWLIQRPCNNVSNVFACCADHMHVKTRPLPAGEESFIIPSCSLFRCTLVRVLTENRKSEKGGKVGKSFKRSS